jgi:eukaryotic-like serine/threonine-protein kinase
VPSVGSSMAPGPGNASSSFTAPSGLSASAGSINQSGARRGLVAALALAGGASLAIVFWIMTRGHAAPQASAPSTANATATADAPASPPPAAADVELRVSAMPSSARIFVDDKPVDGNPFRGKLAKNGVTHTIRVEAEGYAPRTRTVTAEKDLDLELALQHDERADAQDKDASKDKDKDRGTSGKRNVAPQPQQPKDDDVMRAPTPKPKRSLDQSNPYNNK